MIGTALTVWSVIAIVVIVSTEWFIGVWAILLGCAVATALGPFVLVWIWRRRMW